MVIKEQLLKIGVNSYQSLVSLYQVGIYKLSWALKAS